VQAVSGKQINIDDLALRGPIACGMSHLEALRRGKESGAELVFVFEDDFCWELTEVEVKNRLEMLIRREFNILALTYHTPAVQISSVEPDGLAFASNIQTTAAYVVKRQFLDSLIAVFEDAVGKMRDSGDLARFSIDQHWKTLQSSTGETGFYTTVPRLGGQRNDQSDITLKSENYGGSCFVAIISCQKYLYKHNPLTFANCPFPYRIFVGGALGECDDGSLVSLTCDDSYEALPGKVKIVFDWIMKNYPNIGYIFKTDDDVLHEFSGLLKLFNHVSINKLDYAGNIVSVGRSISTYHSGKVSPDLSQKAVRLDPLSYCSGGAYFVSRYAADLINQDRQFPRNIYEDYSVGYALRENKILPASLPIYGQVSFW